MKVKDLIPNTVIIYSEGKGILTVTEVRYLEHNTYAVSFYGINEVSYLDGDKEVTVL